MPDALRTVIFVDGQNFRKNLQAFEFQTGDAPRPYRLDEKHFDWTLFFSDVVDYFARQTGRDHRLVRAYWYNADTMTPFEQYSAIVGRALNACRAAVPNMTADQVCDLARNWHSSQHSWFYGSRRQMFEDIQRRTDFLEFKFVGQFRVEPFTVRKCVQGTDGSIEYQGTQVGEKGVDVGVAVDMISKLADYEVAIIVSGDADFIPAVCHVKNHLRNVYQFSIAKGVPPRITYLSPWLKGIVDLFGYFDEPTLLDRYLDPGASVPPAVRLKIAEHVAALRATFP